MRFNFRKLIFTQKQTKNEAEDFFAATAMSQEKLPSRHNEWVEESYLDYSEEDLSRTDKNYLGLSLSNTKILVFLFLIFVGIFILFTRAGYLQIIKGDYYLSVSEQNRLRVYNIPAPRGIIYDRNGVALVKNVPSFAVFVVPNDFFSDQEQQDSITSWLKERLDADNFDLQITTIKKITPKQKEYYEPVLFVENLEYEKAIQLQIESRDYDGVHVDVIAKREYLNTYQNRQLQSMAHVLGYEGKINSTEYDELRGSGYLLNDYIGKTGIESVFEEQLRGKYGKEQIEVNARGNAVSIIAKEEVRKGDSIYLSIDIEMQKKLEQIINSYMFKYGKSKSAAIVMDPNTGKILSLISLPGFDNNSFASGISTVDYEKLITDPNKPMYNRVVSGEYPSGSTIKPVVAAAALQEGIVSEHTSFISNGGIRIGQWFFPDWRAGGHGTTDVRKALADSVNTYFYIIGGGYGDKEGLGVYKLKEYGEKFGLSSKTGIDLPNEKAGFLPDPEWKQEAKNERWYIGDTYHFAIGQGDVLVTPLQVANYTCAFANNGTLYKTTLLDRIYDQENEQEVVVQPQILNNEIVDPYNLTVIRQGMRQAVRSGSARLLNSLPVSAAGKTGTAQWGTDKDPHAWFTSFAPYEKPELVVTVLVEEGEEGSKISTWIVNDFYNWYFREYK
jgi:penicillin-binding protein 2